MKVTDLKTKAQKELLIKIADGIRYFANQRDGDQIEALLAELEAIFDDLDNYDFFGTEGWKHFFGVEE